MMHKHLGVFVSWKCCSKHKFSEVWFINKLENAPLIEHSTLEPIKHLEQYFYIQNTRRGYFFFCSPPAKQTAFCLLIQTRDTCATSLSKLINMAIYHWCTNKIHSLLWHICQANIRKSNHRSLERYCVYRWTSTSSISGSNSLALILRIITLIEVLGLVWFCTVAKQHW